MVEKSGEKSKGEKYSALAITSFILSLIFFVPFISTIGFILGIISLIVISRNQKLKGKGFAIAAIIIGLLVTIVWVLLFIFVYSIFSTFSSLGKGTPQEQMNNCLEKSGLNKELCVITTIGINYNQTSSFNESICDTELQYPDTQNLCKAIILKDKSYCYNILDSDARIKCVGMIDEIQRKS